MAGGIVLVVLSFFCVLAIEVALCILERGPESHIGLWKMGAVGGLLCAVGFGLLVRCTKPSSAEGKLEDQPDQCTDDRS